MTLTNFKRPKIAILTLHPMNLGGVLSILKVTHKFCSQYFDPTLFFLGFDKSISANLRSFKFYSGIKKKRYFGMKSIEVGSRWAFWEPGHYKFTLPIWKRLFANYDYFFVVSGTAIAAYPLMLLNKKFVIWPAASHLEDREERVRKFSFFRRLLEFSGSFKMKKIEKKVLQNSGFVFPLSNDTKRSLSKICVRLKEKSLVCPCPIKIKYSNYNQVSKKDNNIIAVGRFSDVRKNVKMLFRVFDLLYKKDQNLRLTIVGLKPDGRIINKFKTFSSFHNIEFTGFIDSKKLEQLYKNSDLMLITSYQEGLGIVGLEALAYGVPVISTKSGGVSDFIMDGQNGFLVDIDDDKAMANVAWKLISKKNILNNFHNFNKDFLEKNFSETKVFSNFEYGLKSVYPELNEIFSRTLKQNIKCNTTSG